MFSLETIREIIYTKKVLGNSINLKVIKTLFIYNAVSKRKIRWIVKHFSKDEDDIIFYSYWLAAGSYALARLKKKGYKFRAIARAHGGDAFLNRGYQSFRDIIYKHLDEIHFVSDAGRQQFYQKVKLPEDSIRANLYTSRLGTEKPREILNPCNNSSEFFHIATCSSIIPLKRLDLLVDALKTFSDYKIKWTHFGDGYLRESIQQLTDEKLDKYNIKVEFMGQVTNSVIHEFYEGTHVDVFINASDYEGIPVSIMEAISYGIPVIARDVGGNNEIVYNKINGILLPTMIGSPELANAIQYFIKLSGEDSLKYRNGAYKVWRRMYDDPKYNGASHIKNIMESSVEPEFFKLKRSGQ